MRVGEIMKQLTHDELIKLDKENTVFALTYDLSQDFIFLLSNKQGYVYGNASTSDVVYVISSFMIITYKTPTKDIKSLNLRSNSLLELQNYLNDDYYVVLSRLGEIPYNGDNYKNKLAFDAKMYQRIYKLVLPDYLAMKKLSEYFGINLWNIKKQSVCELLFTPITKPNFSFKYIVPTSIKQMLQYCSTELNNIVNDISKIDFTVVNGKITHGDKLPIYHKIGDLDFNIGIGGIHSNSTECTIKSNVYNYDVSSYYVNLLTNDNIFISMIGQDTVEKLRAIYNKRIEIKQNNYELSDGLKIVLASYTGKLNEPHSKNYCPQAYLQMTMTGQLLLLILSEFINKIGAKIIFVNTDGICVRTHDKNRVDKAVEYWCKQTKLKVNCDKYLCIKMDNINSYMAVKSNNEFIGKGSYNPDFSLNRSNNLIICSMAINLLFSLGIPIQQTIRKMDFKLLLINRKSGEQTYQYYFSYNGNPYGLRDVNGKKIPNSEHCCFYNGGKCPEDIMYTAYIEKAEKMLNDLGFIDEWDKEARRPKLANK